MCARDTMRTSTTQTNVNHMTRNEQIEMNIANAFRAQMQTTRVVAFVDDEQTNVNVETNDDAMSFVCHASSDDDDMTFVCTRDASIVVHVSFDDVYANVNE